MLRSTNCSGRQNAVIHRIRATYEWLQTRKHHASVPLPSKLYECVLMCVSIRAVNVLWHNDINDLDALLTLTHRRMLSFRHCGVLTAEEILGAQEAVRELCSMPSKGLEQKPTTEADASSDVLSWLVDRLKDPDHVYGAIVESLSVRTRNVLGNNEIRDLGKLCRLTPNHLIRLRNCGRKTIAEIVAIQARLAAVAAKAMLEKDASICTSVLAGLLDGEFSIADEAGRIIVDPDQPYESLIQWVSAVCSRSENQRMAFLLRYGMYGCAPATFRHIGNTLGLTRARAHQLAKRAEQNARKPDFRAQLRPLIARAAQIIAMHGGSLTAEELVSSLLANGTGGDMLSQATPFVEFLASLPDWQDAGLRAGSFCTREAAELRLPSEGNVRCRQKADMPKRVLRNPDEFTTFDLARFLGVNRRTLLGWLLRGLLPEPARRGNKRIWTREEALALKAWITKR